MTANPRRASKGRALAWAGLAMSLAMAACGPRPEPAPPPPVAPKPPPIPARGPVTNGGAIDGVVSYAGPLTDESVAITRDPMACGAHDGAATRPAGALLVAEGRLGNVVAWLDGVPQGKPLPSSTVIIENIGCAFVPRVAIGFVGGKVAASNSDSILHDTSLAYVDDGTSIGHLALPGAGSRIERTLRRPGLVAVRCETHDWMQGWLHVMDQPYAAITDV